MKVIQVGREDSSLLTEDEINKISILKLVPVGEYVDKVGIRDGQFYVIAETGDDQMYLAYVNSEQRRSFFSLDTPVQAFYLKKAKELEQLKQTCKRKMG